MKNLSADEIAIRVVLEEVVECCGGHKQAAAALDCDAGHISKLLSTSNAPEAKAVRRYVKASDVLALDRVAGAPVMLGKLCELAGYPLPEKAEPRVAVEGPARHLCELTKEFSEVALALSEAMRAPSISINQRKRLIAEMRDVMHRGGDLIAEMERGIADDTAPLKAVQN